VRKKECGLPLVFAFMCPGFVKIYYKTWEGNQGMYVSFLYKKNTKIKLN
jgi:hypothetical protein